MQRTVKGVILIATGIGLFVPPLSAQTQVSALLQQLESRRTTDSARTQLLQLGRSDPKARQYLAIHLPLLIAADPRNPDPSHEFLRRQWMNAVYLAGALRLVEAAPVLAKRLNVRSTPLSGDYWNENLGGLPAGYALCQIGDPTIPLMERMLADGNSDQRTNAAYVLGAMNSPKSVAVLEDYAKNGKDRQLANYLRTNRLNGAESKLRWGHSCL